MPAWASRNYESGRYDVVRCPVRSLTLRWRMRRNGLAFPDIGVEDQHPVLCPFGVSCQSFYDTARVVAAAN